VAFDLTIAPVATSATFRTNTTITLGTAPAEGSLIVVMLAHENKAGITATMPSGFTAHAASPISHSVADFKCYVAWKIAGAGESASQTWTHGNAFTQGAIFNITGNATSFVIEGTSTSAQATNGTSFSFPSITTISDNAALVAVGFSTTESTNNTDTWTSPLTERADTTLIDIGAGTQAVAGASGAKSANTSIANLVSFMMAIAPESGPPPQLLQPDSTESAGAWTTDTGGTTNLHLAVDEAQPGSDTDYIQSALVPDGTSPVELGLPTPATPDTGVSRLRWRRRASAAYGDRIPTLDVALYRGATLVESFTDPLVPTLASSWSTAEIALTNTPGGWSALGMRAPAALPAAAVPTVVGVGTASFTATNGAALTPALPTGWAANDIHILVVHRSDNTAITTPSGWTKWTPGGVAETNTTAQIVSIYWRRAVAGDTAPSVTAGTSTVVRGAFIIGVRGCPLTGDPLHLALRENKAASATVSNAGVTTTVANTRALFIYAYEDDPSAASTPAGWAAITPQVSALGNDMALGFSHKAMAATGATGAVSTTVSGGTFANSPHATFTLTLLPAAGADARVQISWFELQVPAAAVTGGSATLVVATSAGAAPVITATGGAAATFDVGTSTGAAPSPTATAGSASTLPVATSAGASPAVTATAGAAATLTVGTSAAAAPAISADTGAPASATLVVATSAGAAPSPAATGGAQSALVSATAASAAPSPSATAGAAATLAVGASASAAPPITAPAGSAATLTVGTSSGVAPTIVARGGSTAVIPVSTSSGAAPSLSATAGALAALTLGTSAGEAPAISVIGGGASLAQLPAATSAAAAQPLTAIGAASAALVAAATASAAPAIVGSGGAAATFPLTTSTAAASAIIATGGAGAGLVAATSAGAAHPLTAIGAATALLGAATSTAAAPAILAGGLPPIVGSLRGQLIVEPVLSGALIVERILDGELRVDPVLAGVLEVV
jgi:hypothetical protein